MRPEEIKSRRDYTLKLMKIFGCVKTDTNSLYPVDGRLIGLDDRLYFKPVSELFKLLGE